MLQMLATDKSLLNEGNDSFVRVLLYSANSLCNKFFNGISPTNLYLESSTRMLLERYIGQICRFNVIIDAVVERLEVPAVQGRTITDERKGSETQTVLRMVSGRLKPL